MIEYREEIERRIEQFADRLRSMHSRAHEEACGSSFMIFNECDPHDSGDSTLEETQSELVSLLSSALTGIGDSTVFLVPGEEAYGELPDEDRGRSLDRRREEGAEDFLARRLEDWPVRSFGVVSTGMPSRAKSPWPAAHLRPRPA